MEFNNSEFWKFVVNNGIALVFCVFLGYIILKYLPILSKTQLLMVQLLEQNREINKTIQANSEAIGDCSKVMKDNCEVMRDVKVKFS